MNYIQILLYLHSLLLVTEMKVCGPTLSLCGLILSAWGVVQLVLMGVFYYIKSVALFEDIGLEEELEKMTPDEFYIKADALYTQSAYNCWIAACIYVLLLIFSAHQFYMNSQSSHSHA